MDLVSKNEYVAGWLKSSVRSFLDILSHLEYHKNSYMLFTSLDSQTDLTRFPETHPLLRTVKAEIKILGTGIQIPRSVFLKFKLQEILTGFDEVWFFPIRTEQPKPTNLTLVGPDRTSQATLDLLIPWMSENSCSLALGDGAGLNFIVRSYGWSRALLGHSITQPDTYHRSDHTKAQTETTDESESAMQHETRHKRPTT